MNHSDEVPRTVGTKVIGICGIGQMGAAAAVAFQRAGYRVLLWARNEDKLRAIEPGLAELASWSNENLGPARRAGGEIILEADLAKLDAAADVVLECILEVMEEKAALFRRLKGAHERGALLLSATSGLSITEMGRRGECEASLVGAHFWNPPHLIPVVEMIAGLAFTAVLAGFAIASRETIATTEPTTIEAIRRVRREMRNEVGI